MTLTDLASIFGPASGAFFIPPEDSALAALGKVSLRLRTNGDSTLDSEYPLGDKPTGGFTWTITSSLDNLVTGTPFSENVRAMLSGTNAASAVITIVTVSGADAAAAGWGVASAGTGNNLTHPGTQTGPGYFFLRATFGGQSKDSPPRSWSFAAAGTDALAPTIPTGYSVTPINGGVAIAHDASSDPYDGTNPASLVKDYRVKLGASVVQTQTSGVQAGLSPTYTLYNIGTIASPGAPSFTQNGAGGTLAAAGTGIHGVTTDQCAFRGAAVSGDFAITVKVNQYTSSNQFSTFGLMVRETTNATSAYVAVYQQPSQGQGVQVKRRASTSATSSNRTAVTAILSGYIRIKRVGADFFIARSDTGQTWTDMYTVSDTPMATTVYAGLFGASQTAGTSVSVIFEQLNLNNAPAMAYNVTSVTGGVWTILARDNSNNESAATTGISATPLSAPVTDLVRYYPGHYVWYSSAYWNDTQKAGLTSMINSLAGNDNIRGIQYIPLWRQLVSSGSPDGDRTAHYARVREIFDFLFTKLQAVSPQKKLIFGVGERGFGNDGASSVIPQYIIDAGEYVEAPSGTTYTGGLKCCTKQWGVPVRDWFIDLLTYIAQQYGTVSNFAMIGAGESAIGVPIGTGGFTYEGFGTQTKRVFDACKAAYRFIPMRWKANFWGDVPGMLAIYEHIIHTTKEGGVVIGGPDPEFNLPFPTTSPRNAHRSITANRLFSGDTRNSAGDDWLVGGGHDYRTEVPWVGEWQAFGMEGVRSGYNEPPADVWAYNYGTANNQMKADYMIWLSQNYTGNTAQKWPGASGLKVYVDSLAGQHNDHSATLLGNWELG